MWDVFINFVSAHTWILEGFFAVLGTAVVSYVATRVYRRLYPRLKASRTVWDDTLLYALHLPLKVAIWTVGLSVAAQLIGSQTEHHFLLAALPVIRKVAIIGLISWFLLRFISRGEKRVHERRLERKEVDQTTVRAVCQIMRASVVVTAGLISLQTFGIPISGVVAFGGVGGLVIGLAAKDLLANFFGGLMIFLDRPFKVGDWIRSPDKEIEGTVEHIGWRLTRIRTFSKRPLYVPNGTFSTISVENPSRMTNRRIYTNVGVRYDDASKIATLLSTIEEMLRNHPEIDTKQTLMVNLVEFGPSSLNFMIYTFTKTTDWVRYQAIQQDVFLKVIEIIEAHGAQCAFPTTTLHIPEGIDVRQLSGLRPSSDPATLGKQSSLPQSPSR